MVKNYKNMKPYKIAVLVQLIVMFGVSCNESPTNNDAEIGNGRIVLNGSIDGIKIGDDTLSVIQKLGRPDYFADLDLDAFVWGYKVDNTGSLEIGFVKNYPITSIYSVFQLDARQGYEGKTIEGIGIGSSRDFVRSKLGNECVAVQGNNLNMDYYRKAKTPEGYLGTVFYFDYDENNYITTISMQYSK